MALERLQKIIAAAGIASRRKAEELITSGRVAVNGKTVTELGSKADPERDHIRVDDRLLRGPERHVYLLLHKPKGYVTTVSDPQGRPTVMSLLRGVGQRVYPVGRLDWASEGLVVLTNDGELAAKLMHASYHVPKTYLVKTSGRPSEEALARLRSGVFIRDGARRVKTAPARISLAREGENPWFEVVLTQGRNRQIRKMFETVGHRVEKIKRVAYGPLGLDIPAGGLRHLTPVEVERLRAAVRGDARRVPARTSRVPARKGRGKKMDRP